MNSLWTMVIGPFTLLCILYTLIGQNTLGAAMTISSKYVQFIVSGYFLNGDWQ